MAMANIELLDGIIEHIRAHPETWDQDTWARPAECGTAYCVAGHAVVMTTGVQVDKLGLAVTPLGGWSDAGTEALGLTFEQAEVLFRADNSLPDIVEYRDRLVADPHDDLGYYA